MRVAMVMPMSPDSAIADVMCQALPALAAQWDLEVWCPSSDAYRPCPVPLNPFLEPDRQVVEGLAAFDLVVYVLGDSMLHTRILPIARQLPGLVVIHDASLTNLVRGAAVETATLEALALRVETTAGADQADILLEPRRAGGSDGWMRFCEEVPLDDVAVEGSLGVVVHSLWHARRVAGRTLGEVTVAPLPAPSRPLGATPDDQPEPSSLLADLPDDAVLVITVGHLNANRRIDLLLRAMADDGILADRVHLWAVGPAQDGAREDLLDLARALGLQEKFAITGRVGDDLLHAFLARADIGAALRDPVLEGQSASALTQLQAGLPVLVFDHAHYAELPDLPTVKVELTGGFRSIRAALTRLVESESERARRGAAARDFVLQTRTASAYAAALLDAGDLALATRPLVHLGTDLGNRLSRLDLHREPAVVNAVADLAFDLFDLA